jgi:hypothetical protein
MNLRTKTHLVIVKKHILGTTSCYETNVSNLYTSSVVPSMINDNLKKRTVLPCQARYVFHN